MNNRYTILFLLFTLLSLLNARNWTNKEGEKIAAELVAVKEDHIIIRLDSNYKRYEVKIADLSTEDQLYLKNLQKGPEKLESVKASEPPFDFIKDVGKHLVDKKGRDYEKMDIYDKDYYLVYYSAHWCPPCRKFTPKLVELYDKRSKRGNFEVIFVSSDRSADAMEKYMQETDMNWAAVDFEKIKKTNAKRFAGNGIPCLVLLDNKGNVLSDSYINGKYVGPYKVLDDLEKKL